jgi:hypothetical protein
MRERDEALREAALGEAAKMLFHSVVGEIKKPYKLSEAKILSPAHKYLNNSVSNAPWPGSTPAT